MHKTHNVHNDLPPMHGCKSFAHKHLQTETWQKRSPKKISCICMIALAATVAGCSKGEGISHYRVTKPELIDPTLVAKTSGPGAPTAPTTEQQTIGLIVPVGDTGWFFKLTGDKTAVEPQHEAFLEFIGSIKFAAADGKPSWKLPAGWKELPGNQMRFATIQIAAEGKPLDLSVIPLPTTGGETQKYVLDNVNRWRGQLKLEPISAAELSTTTKTLKIDGHESTLVSLVGTGGGGMTGAPFAPFAGGRELPPDHPPIGKATSTTSDKPKSN